MHNQDLFHFLMGAHSMQKPCPKGIAPTPDSESCIFLATAHAMEYYLIGPEQKKVVSLFFGSEEFAVRSHVKYSNLVTLDTGDAVPFTYSMIIRTLRKFPETRTQYREMRKRYNEKVAKRLHSLKTMTAPERFRDLKATQPWVFDLAKEEDIISYLGMSGEMYRSMKK